MREVERRIFFYRAFVGEQVVQREAQFNFPVFCRAIQNAAPTPEGRYLDDGDDSVLAAYVDGERSLRFGRIRRSNLPLLVEEDRFREIQVSDRGGIFECVHVRYFPPATLGVVFNFYAPRISRLAQYMKRKGGLNRQLELLPIVARNPLDAYNRFSIVKKATIKVATASLPDVRRHTRGVIADIVRAAGEAGSTEIEVTFSSPTGRTQADLGAQIQRGLRSLLGADDPRGILDKMHVSGYLPETTRLDSVDLLADDLISSKSILLESRRGRALDNESAYDQIAAAFQELRPDRL
jgi:hypothetical protein